MKRLFFLFFLAFPLFGQSLIPGLPDPPPPQWMTSLDGTQYHTKSNPVNMDLNGAERLTNPTFNTDTSSWTVANGSMATSAVQKHSGSKSCLLVASAANASITSETIADATTNKGTGEVWVWVGLTASTKSVKLVLLDQAGATIDSTLTTCTGATWTKLVKNEQWSGTQTGLKEKIGFNGGLILDSMYIDDVSLTQAFDAIFAMIINPKEAKAQRLIQHQGAAYNILSLVSGNAPRIDLSDGTSSASAIGSNGSIALNSNQFVCGTIDRTGNATVYVNAIQTGTTPSLAAVGKIIPGATVYIGGGSSYFNGNIGETQFITGTFSTSQFASMAADIYNRFKSHRGFANAYPNGQISGWWGTSSNYGADKTGNNPLTPVNNPPTLRMPR